VILVHLFAIIVFLLFQTRTVNVRKEAAARTAPFQPVMKTSIHLHQLAKVRLALATLTVFLASAAPAPQPGFQHPAAQRTIAAHEPARATIPHSVA
jgi:hypothetical protein